MPPVKSSASRCRNKLVSLIFSISKVMPSCSHYIERGLLCVIIVSPSSRQPLSCAKYTTINIHSSYNIHLVSDAEYKHLIAYLSRCMPCLICSRVLDLICC